MRGDEEGRHRPGRAGPCKMDGDVKMNLGDEKLEGMRQANVVVNFAPENAAAAEGVEKDARKQEARNEAELKKARKKYGGVAKVAKRVCKLHRK